MQMRPHIQIAAMVKALQDVVLPAVDPDNQMAQEQAKLCVGMLNLMAHQLPRQFRFDCDELARLIDLGEQLDRDTADEAGVAHARATLNSHVGLARDTLQRAGTDPSELAGAVNSVRVAAGQLVSATFDNANAATIAVVQQRILDSSAEQLLRDRSLLLAQGWESKEDGIPPIDELLVAEDT